MRKALALFGALAAGSAVCGVTGVYILAGLGWALIAVSVPMGAVALVLGRGLIRHG